MKFRVDQPTRLAIEDLVNDLFAVSPEVIGVSEIIPGCEIIDIPAGGPPKYITCRINRYYQEVLWRGIPDSIAVGDEVAVIHLREGNVYEVLAASGASGIVGDWASKSGDETITGSWTFAANVNAAAGVTFDGLDLSELGSMIFDQDDLLLFNPDWEIWKVGSQYRLMESRFSWATLTGAIHWGPGRWEGTRGLHVEEATTNLCTNPSIEVNTNGWVPAGGGTAVAQSTEDAVYGINSLKVTPGAGMWDGTLWGTLNMTMGTTYIASIWFKGEAGTPYVFGLYDTIATAYVGARNNFTATGEWQRVVTTAGAAVGNNTAQLWIRKNNNASTTAFYVDGAQIETKAYETTYCDGSQGIGYAWTGGAHASTSTRALTEVNLDDRALVCSSNDTFSIRIVCQAPHDSTVTWSSPNHPFLWVIYGANVNNYAYLRFVTGSGFALYINGANRIVESVTFSQGDWLDIIVTFDFANDEYKLYLNGELLGTDTTALTAPVVNQMNLGAAYNASYPWGGAFSEFAMFDRVLTVNEIANLHAHQRPLIDPSALFEPVHGDCHYYDASNEVIYVETPTGLMAISISSTTTVAAKVYRSAGAGNQNVPNNTWTALIFDTEVFDVGNNWVPGSPTRFTPATAGYYTVGANARWDDLMAGQNGCLYIMKNGVKYIAGVENEADYMTQNVNCVTYFNGSTDYVEFYVYQNTGGAKNISACAAGDELRCGAWIGKLP